MHGGEEQAREDYSAAAGWSDRQWAAFLREHDPLIRSVTQWTRWRFAPHVAEEVAQSVRVALPASLPRFQGDAPVAQFVKRIAMHACIDQVRREFRSRQHVTSLTSAGADGEEYTLDPPAGAEFDPRREILADERAARLRALLDALDETCRHAIRMFYLEEIDYNAMAEKLGIAVNTVGSRLAKCRDKLRGLAKEDPSWQEG